MFISNGRTPGIVLNFTKEFFMRFSRLFGSGLNSKSSDPREKVWAEFHCSLCDENTEIDVTGRRDTFQFDVERRCPKCGQINAGDKALNLQSQLDKLVSDKSRIQIAIDKIEREINELKGASNGIKSDFSSEEVVSGKNQEGQR